MEDPLIRLINVSKRFGDQVVLKDINLDIHRGRITTIIGKSGGGKSVLLKQIIGLIKPDTGQVLFDGRPLSKLRKVERNAVMERFSYMFQQNALFESMTVFENIALPLTERATLTEEEIRQRVRDRMAQLDLEGIDRKYPSQISGGMKKRVAMARALITDPEIVLFDEPTTGLDPIRRNAVHSMITDFRERFGFTAVIVSHEIPDIFYISQQIVMLHEGRIFFSGTPEEIQQSQDPVIEEFLMGLESHRDPLTGMRHRTHGERRFLREMGRLELHHTAFSIILFSIDNLDAINEKAGHVFGQQLVRDFAGVLQDHLRVTDTCARFGLNKIMAILPNTGKEEARRICGNLIGDAAIRDMIGIGPHRECRLSVSAGIAEAQEGNGFEDVIHAAESNKTELPGSAVQS
jgi:phospholipid/cholesterol/gamma-HCH transport system ATP-binding protein